MSRRRRAPPRHAVRLLDEYDTQTRDTCRARHREEILRLDAAARAVTEDERSARLVNTVDVRVRRAERRRDL